MTPQEFCDWCNANDYKGTIELSNFGATLCVMLERSDGVKHAALLRINTPGEPLPAEIKEALDIVLKYIPPPWHKRLCA